MDDSTEKTTTRRKRQYAAHRVTKSVRMSETPGVQVLNMNEDGMPEIKQTKYRSSVNAHWYRRELDCDRALAELSEVAPGNDVFAHLSYISSIVALSYAKSEAQLSRKGERLCSEPQNTIFDFAELLQAVSIIKNRVRPFDSDLVSLSGLKKLLEEVSETYRPKWDGELPFQDWGVLEQRYWDPIKTLIISSIEFFNKKAFLSEANWIIHVGPECAAAKYLQSLRGWIEANNAYDLNEVLDRERDIMNAYESGKHEHIAEKHRDFVACCGKLLHEAQQRHDVGDSSLLNLLIEHNVPEKWWKTGWQKFLDHLWAKGDVGAVESYIQQAYAEVNRLRDETPVLRRHWDKCLEGLNMYSRRLHRRPDPGGPCSTLEEEDEGGGHGLIHFASQWTVPLSAIGSTVLRGWHLIGTKVSHDVYERVGYIFCTVDLKWFWSS